jgi:uncharacterized protein (TIGR04255 family)
MKKTLKYKPLVEAILEIRWKLQRAAPSSPEVDPHYKLLPGLLFDRMRDRYPHHEPLPTANAPDELAGYIIQHRFRVAPDSWPLVQIGPGVLTINSTEDYKWEDFRPRVEEAFAKLYDAHPNRDDLTIISLILRYIDAVELDFSEHDTFTFLKNKLKVSIAFPDALFHNTGVEKQPYGFAWQSSFKSTTPRGLITIRFATGQKTSRPALIWETTVEAAGDDVPDMPQQFHSWLDAAHDLILDWFFKIIEGELERRFTGE